MKRHLLIPLTAALSKSLKPEDLITLESATWPSAPIKNDNVTVPVSSLRRDDFGHSGFAQVLKSATAATFTDLAGPGGAAGGAGGAFCSSFVAGLTLVAFAIVFCGGGGCYTFTSTGGMKGGGGAFISGGGGGGGSSFGGGGLTSSIILVSTGAIILLTRRLPKPVTIP